VSGDEPEVAFFVERAGDFLRATDLRQQSDIASVEADLHAMCCAIELSLKAVLLAEGRTDEQNRVALRHDLGKALAAAELVGFAAPEGLGAAVARLSPCYARHRLRDLEGNVTPGELARIGSIVREHLRRVAAWVAGADSR
jgi:HEPN domain-containing protein